MLATIVDVHALAKILLAALVVGVGVTALFGQGALAYERLGGGGDGGLGARLRDGAIVALTAAVCVGAVVVGFLAMLDK
jgi:hypothetical protein